MSSLNKKFPRLLPTPITRGQKASDLIDGAFKAYNGGRLAEACRLLTNKMLAKDGTVGLSLTGGHSGAADDRS